MSEKHYVAEGVVVKWTGLFDLEEIYKKSKAWFDTKVMDFKEEKYIERFKGSSKQLEIKWKATKNISPYFRKVIEIGILVIGITKVEVEKDGRKITLEKGDVEFHFKAYLLKNASEDFEEGSWYKKFYEVIYRNRINNYLIDIYNDLYGLIDEVKMLLEMHA